ncbi:RlpA-like double-psi beta-barrel-protein domain-containing protein-containing protein, partial [Rhizoctonia solani]
NPSAGTGACGWQNYDYEWVAAVGTQLFQELIPDGNPNHSAACGKTATATWNGKSITLGIVDRCPGCGYDDIDLAPAAFQQFADLGEYCSLTHCILLRSDPLTLRSRCRKVVWV